MSNHRTGRRLAPFAGVLLLLGGTSCRDLDRGARPGSRAPQAGEVTLIVAYGSEKKTWLEEQARRFEATGPKTPTGKPITIQALAMGSGEAVQAILRGELRPHVFSPASGLYVTLLNDAWMTTTHGTRPLSPAGEPIVLSPLVIALWRPMAEALGWPGRPIGWSTLARVSVNPQGWAAYGHPEWGRFKLGHTHPEFSTSGLLSVLAEAYAGAHKTRDLTGADLDAATTRTLVGTVERSIVHYGKSTGFFADKMLERGPTYLSAAVLYENLVIESYGRPTAAPFPIVALYPTEGTFWADHPYAILDAGWVGDEQRQAAEAFLAFLKARPQQQRALALGFRPADPAVATGAPVDAAHGVDARQPQTLLAVPDAPTLAQLLALWRTTKRAADLILVFDKSGSMAGPPLSEAKRGAKAFLDSLHAGDQVTLLAFDHRLYPPEGPVELPGGRAALSARIDGLFAGGGTSLYDALDAACRLAAQHAAADPSRTHTVVAMTDGADQNSALSLAGWKARFAHEGGQDVRVFTIAYGDQASASVLAEIAEAAQGGSARGDMRDIVQVYQDMASFF